GLSDALAPLNEFRLRAEVTRCVIARFQHAQLVERGGQCRFTLFDLSSNGDDFAFTRRDRGRRVFVSDEGVMVALIGSARSIGGGDVGIKQAVSQQLSVEFVEAISNLARGTLGFLGFALPFGFTLDQPVERRSAATRIAERAQ